MDGRKKTCCTVAGSIRIFGLVVAGALSCVCSVFAQDSPPSLGDAARQARLQKQQKEGQAQASPSKATTDNPTVDKEGKANEALATKPKKVITNDEIPEHVGPTSTRPVTAAQRRNGEDCGCTPPSGPNPAMNAGDFWKSQIQAMKSSIAMMEQQLARLDQSVQFSQTPCATTNCVENNQRQRQKETQSQVLKSQIEQMRQRMEQMQETARQQGFGSSVYDP